MRYDSPRKIFIYLSQISDGDSNHIDNVNIMINNENNKVDCNILFCVLSLSKTKFSFNILRSTKMQLLYTIDLLHNYERNSLYDTNLWLAYFLK